MCLTTIPNETLLNVTCCDEKWYAVEYGDYSGYVLKMHIQLTDDIQDKGYVGKVIGGDLNLRRQRSTTSESIIRVPDNSCLKVYDFDFPCDWYCAYYSGYCGYVMKEYIDIGLWKKKWKYGQATVNDLNIRRQPNKKATRWNNVWPENRIAIMMPVNENWFETLYRGEQAFVSAEFITLLDCEVPADIVQRMLYMVKPEIGRVNPVYFNGYTGQWCHRFADWLAMHAGTPKNLIPNTSNCGKGIVWFVNDAESGGFYFKNAEHKARMIGNYSTIRHLPKELTEEEATYTPSPGDYIYFRWRNAAKDVNVSHVGIVSSVSEDKLTTVEGNAGGTVANRSYALDDDRIVGYGKPRYDAVG